MTAARTTQVVVEALVQPIPRARVTQVVVEALVGAPLPPKGKSQAVVMA